jgi:FPC/CPF motif-containing protein YcgG
LAEVSISDAWSWIRESTFCPFAQNARVWIGPDWTAGTTPMDNLRAIASELDSFCRNFRNGRYAGFVMEVIADQARATDTQQATALFCWLLSELVHIEGRSISADWAEIEAQDWQYVFAGTRMFMNLFAPCYPSNHTKHIPFADRIIVFAQPEESFDFCGVNPSRVGLKKHIRDRFSKEGKPYSGDLIDGRIEAHLYVFPMTPEDPPVRWWEGGAPGIHR